MTKKEKSKGLGRGLDAFFGGDLAGDLIDENESVAVEELPIRELVPGRFQPRSRMAPDALEALAASIREEGVLSPIIVRRLDAGYEIVAGERRFQAAKKAGLDTIPAIVRDLDDRHAMAVGLIENIQREDLNPIEEALGIRRLQEEFGLTHEECARAIGRSRSATTNLLRLLGLSEEVQKMLAEGELEMGHARALLGLEGAEQVAAAKRVALQGLSVRQTEELVKKTKSSSEKKEPKPRVVIKTRDDERLEEALTHTLGTVVKLTASPKGKGRIVIEFSNLEQLQGIVDRIQH